MKKFQCSIIIEAHDSEDAYQRLRRDGYADHQIVGDIVEREDWGHEIDEEEE